MAVAASLHFNSRWTHELRQRPIVGREQNSSAVRELGEGSNNCSFGQVLLIVSTTLVYWRELGRQLASIGFWRQDKYYPANFLFHHRITFLARNTNLTLTLSWCSSNGLSGFIWIAHPTQELITRNIEKSSFVPEHYRPR